MKICLLTDSLSSGGAEKMVANLSVSLNAKGYDVHIVSMKDEIEYSYEGTLFNFGMVKQSNNKLLSFFKFKQFFKKENFDFIIDHRVRKYYLKEFMFSKFIFRNSKIIYCVHHFNLGLYFPLVKIPSLARAILNKKKRIVVVSDLIKNKIKNNLNLASQVIYNYTIHNNKKDTFLMDSKFIIAVGRLVTVKQFDVLIKSYKNSKLPENNVKLLILGVGEEQDSLSELIVNLNLIKHVELLGFKANIETYIGNASFLVLSSESEGFPMVLIESLALKTPVISFDCQSGPSEIIKHEENGLLVENQNKTMLTEAMNRLILDKALYSKIKGNLDKSSNSFSEEIIINQWVELLENF